MPNPVVVRRAPGVGTVMGGPTITVDTYTPLNDSTPTLQNGTIKDFALPSRVFSASNTALISGTGVNNINPVCDFHTNYGSSTSIGCYTTAAALNFTASQPFTMFCWVNFNAVAGFEALMGNNDASNTSGWYIGIWVANWAIRGFDGSGTDVHFDIGSAPSLNTWYFVAGGYDGANLWMQINAGTRLTQALASYKAATGNYAVGNYSNSGSSHRAPNGLLGGVGMAKRTLTLNEISQIYNGGLGQLPGFFI